jgi:hypothetical protein
MSSWKRRRRWLLGSQGEQAWQVAVKAEPGFQELMLGDRGSFHFDPGCHPGDRRTALSVLCYRGPTLFADCSPKARPSLDSWAGFVGLFCGTVQEPAHAQPQQKPSWAILNPVGPVGPNPGA